MWMERYTPEQIALVLLQAALGFEYYMEEGFDLYDVEPGSAGPKRPAWSSWANDNSNRLDEWCQQQIYELGLGVWEQETFGDQLILDDFHPIAEQIANMPEPRGGKVAFLALTIALVLKAFAEHVNKACSDLADALRGAVEGYLHETWGVDLARGIFNPELVALHWPKAREAAGRCRQRLELLTRPPLRAPLADDQVASLNAYQAEHIRDPFFLCLVKGCGRVPLRVDREGLSCPKCDQRRDWVWSWMADWSWQRGWDANQGKPEEG